MSTRRSARRSAVASSIASSNTSVESPANSEASGGAGGGNDEASTAATATPTPTPAASTAKPGSGKFSSECSLFMECDDEPMSAIQKSVHQQKVKDFKDQMAKLEAIAAKGASVTMQPDGGAIVRTTETVTSALSPAVTTRTTVTAPSMTPGGGVVAGAAGAVAPTGLQPGYRLLMDPRTGRVLGTINGAGQPAGPVPVGGPIPTAVRPMAPQQPPVQIRPTPPTAARAGPKVARPAVVDLTRGSPVGGAGSTGSGSGTAKQKEWPCLCVIPKSSKTGTVPNAAAKRSELDAKVKSLLVHTAAKFTEWLIQQSLVPTEQTEGGSKLKLGMYSDTKRFPNSGGYVWICETNSNKFVSVFKGSIFEASSHSPTVVLKLIYHWSCQTNINNVIQWVKVDHHSVNFYWQLFRSVCVATVQEELTGFGGSGKVVEIGVISLGTTTSDGNKREVRVEVLGVMDRATGRIRLRATEPVPGATQSERFTKIFEPVPVWIERSSKIVTDFSIDKERLSRLGYNNISQCSLSNKRVDATNSQVMDYLKRVVPKMFQNNLSLLSTNEIQQFLDELTFREVFGHFPLACFDSLIQRIANQTVAASAKKTGGTVSQVLKRIALDTFDDWRLNKPVRQQ